MVRVSDFDFESLVASCASAHVLSDAKIKPNSRIKLPMAR